MFAGISSFSAKANIDAVKISYENERFIRDTTEEVVDDGWWMCLEWSRTEEYSYFSQTTTVTITYLCYWMEF